jgi:hypothetical protein
LPAAALHDVSRGLTLNVGRSRAVWPEVLPRSGMFDTFPTATARRNLLQRIDRFVTALERSQRPPTAHEAQGVLDALASLELRLYPLGEEAMMRVEKAGRRRGGRVWPGRPNRSS